MLLTGENQHKVAHYISIKSTHKEVNIAEICMREIFRLYRMHTTIISEKRFKIYIKFWKGLFEGLDTQLNFSIAYHPQTNG
jgi:hypothetical protein